MKMKLVLCSLGLLLIGSISFYYLVQSREDVGQQSLSQQNSLSGEGRASAVGHDPSLNSPDFSGSVDSYVVDTSQVKQNLLASEPDTKKEYLANSNDKGMIKTTFQKWAQELKDWNGKYFEASVKDKALLLEDAKKLLENRREELKELIKVDPQLAWDVSISEWDQQIYPEELKVYFEKFESSRGDYSHVMTTGTTAQEPAQEKRYFRNGETTYEVYTYGKGIYFSSRDHTPFRGLIVDHVAAMHENRLENLKGENVRRAMQLHPERIRYVLDHKSTKRVHITSNGKTYAPAKSAKAAQASIDAVEVGGEIYIESAPDIDPIYQECLCSINHVGGEVLNLGNEEHSGYEDGAVLGSPRSEGSKKVLYIRVDFPDKTGDPTSESSVRNLHESQITSFYQKNSYGKFGTITVDVTPTYRMTKPVADYKNADDSGYMLHNEAVAAATAAGYNVNSYDIWTVAFKTVFSGWAGQAEVGAKRQWLNGYFDFRVTVHETGHNLGLWHANFWNTSGKSIIGAGANLEYGNRFDVMGDTGVAEKHLSAAFKHQLNYLLDDDIYSVTSSGIYQIVAHDKNDVSTMKAALRIPINGMGYYNKKYFVDFRQLLTTNSYLMNGVSLYFQEGTQVQLLDTTPSSAAASSAPDREDSPLTIGRMFSDEIRQIFITPIGLGGTSPQSINVLVNFGPFPGNQEPVVNLGASTLTALVGQTITLAATATDADGDPLAYYWNYGDGTISFNNASQQTKSWSTAGVYNVRCEVSDSRGGLTAKEMLVTVGTPASSSMISGQVINADTSEPIKNVLMKWGTKSVYTDSDGHYCFTNLADASATLGAYKDGIVFTVDGFTNPVAVGPDKVCNWKGTLGKISGVVKLSGTPIPDVIISYYGASSGSVVTASDGTYIITNVPDGSYTLYATYAPGIQTATVSATMPANNIKNFNFTTSTVKGTVKDIVTNLGIDSAVLNYNYPSAGSGVAASDGTYTLSFVTGQNTNVTISAAKAAGGYSPSDSQSVTIPPNKTNINFFLEQAEYVVQKVEPFAGGVNTQLYGMNKKGDLVGRAEKQVSGQVVSVPFLWKHDTQTKVEIGNFTASSYAAEVNNNREVIGYGNSKPFYWSELTGVIYIPSLPGSSSLPSIQKINNLGVVVGSSQASDGKMHPIIWSKDIGIVDLGLMGAQYGYGYDINDSNEVAGSIYISSATHGFYWSSVTGMIDLGHVGAYPTNVNTINNLGEIVGYSKNNSNAMYAFVWDKTNLIKNLGDFTGVAATGATIQSIASNNIENTSEVVGYAKSTVYNTTRPFVGNFYDGLTDLGTLGGNGGSAAGGSDINYIYGYSDTSALYSAQTLWRPGKAPKAVLNLVETSVNLSLNVVGVNNKGQIGVSSYDPIARVNKALLLVPVNNLAPFSVRERIAVDQNSSKTFTLKGIDPEEQTLTYTVVTQPSKGVLSGTAPNLTYTPNTGYLGTDTFTFSCSDGTYDSNIATLTFVVSPSSKSIISSTNSITVNEGGTATYQIKLNMDPSASVVVTTAFVSGDSDLSVNGGASLTFDSSNWNTYQTVTIQAAEDGDVTNGSCRTQLYSHRKGCFSAYLTL